jgi:hypothetical protein
MAPALAPLSQRIQRRKIGAPKLKKLGSRFALHPKNEIEVFKGGTLLHTAKSGYLEKSPQKSNV